MRPTVRDDSTSGGAVRMRGNSVRKNRPGFQKGSYFRIFVLLFTSAGIDLAS